METEDGSRVSSNIQGGRTLSSTIELASSDNDHSSNRDSDSGGELGFHVDVQADESLRVRPNPRHELARVKRRRFVVSEQEVADATDAWRVEGSSSRVRREFVRGAPRLDEVRPEHVLRDSLDLCCEEWATSQNWARASSQLRAIRQDLQVQRLRGSFAARVYETSARLALQAQDIRQFQQVQMHVATLHADGVVAELADGTPGVDGVLARREFICYRLIYLAFRGLHVELTDALQAISPEDWKSSEVDFALRVISSVSAGNSHQLFKVFQDNGAPHSSKNLLLALSKPFELRLLLACCRAFKGGLSTDRLARFLRRSPSQCRTLVAVHGGAFDNATECECLDIRRCEAAFKESLSLRAAEQ